MIASLWWSCFTWCIVLFSKRVLQGVYPCFLECLLDDFWSQAITDGHVLRNEVILVYDNTLAQQFVAMSWPSMLLYTKNANIKWLGFMCCFRWQCNDDNSIFICDFFDFICFMQIMTIISKQKWFFIDVMGFSFGNKDMLKPEFKYLLISPASFCKTNARCLSVSNI